MDRMHFGQHSSSQFNEALESIRNHLMEMGGLVEKQVVDALEALLHADSALAEKVLTTEDRVDDLEIQIDEECARVLALRQPAASDLRLIIAVSKAVSDLERIGDESAKIAAMALQLAEDGESPRGYVEVRHIGNHVRNMLRDALDAFARFDADKAVEVAAEDSEVDLEYRSAMRALVTFMMEDPRAISRVLNIIWSLRALERIGDHARNIGEQVIFLVKGTDVRHISIDEMEKEVRKKD
ncbi:MAG: phosphate signaling complex protein PhoU [Alcanivorax sp.]|jgi:phosphate transport system protein|uniref:Phosphate-specific transport system accessory protein PhoU n=1 Tax=Alloalcanivorax venustensis ISO4 TaxID=1177184 RepID=A0ABS0AE30_9GAMM|nr:phosphate signaling complex protein PhoU [Alloalcanivorax venustensis]KXJ43894.1 MAG: transcriptional regulator PhoU [Alcanivorax sp. Nap_24]MAK21344.1 phosphate transport system regulatory protein PhoU [Alcanivorax sp.]MCH9784000.1 phosphate signaling complex protein PhoU [Gammaproteobacteria bacterium]MEA3258547.1 phosphate signaling complex protein PhoU [Pseudomonadota bacterium]SMO41116.1 phosphate uptake regulator, PhoU [Alcanivorax sp. DSM 26295]|tara:strand:+ start:15866 stop:16585 length:720 start_codon:yes stop_codon:yes gene_type:complete